MKKLLIATCGLFCASLLVVNAQSTTNAPAKAKRGLTPEQQAVQKQMLEKYDTNKDGKLDKEEHAKMSKEDKQKLRDANKKTAKKAE